jgi:hypothetical protein
MKIIDVRDFHEYWWLRTSIAVNNETEKKVFEQTHDFPPVKMIQGSNVLRPSAQCLD